MTDNFNIEEVISILQYMILRDCDGYVGSFQSNEAWNPYITSNKCQRKAVELATFVRSLMANSEKRQKYVDLGVSADVMESARRIFRQFEISHWGREVSPNRPLLELKELIGVERAERKYLY